MGYFIMAITLVFFLIVGNTENRRAASQYESVNEVSASYVANDMLRIASVINDWRYDNAMNDGVIDIAQLRLVPSPDNRIHAMISNGRLWIWAADFPGLVNALATHSVTSSLVCIVSGGRLRMMDGTDMNLSLPVGVADGNIVYLN
ncbi:MULTISPECIES: type IV pilus biogenesis protein PilM [Pectobacterium]|uniref:type IV pilus biogenesis protein PilM n=1 Tax=Pectobacterium TaxID=122277 RepID=UPI000CD1973B|nr:MULTISPECIES: type IV pilus biogenesis protein PilM [Pectobacterium]POE02639.1 pilM family protein [Pectobacterium odoriferum]UUE35826.1 type IV pilus biogenesis protein PilM [Pectobacterium aroidearum]UUE40200.1 type IV pilus biogenesis protein PilM [Pectobacterium aroidearum]UUE44529.1 type IV pilus biogenesis protein PilM [Pectobacterium aroidearum]UUE48749.1 type IV pilus biogenesis protein PilM [Pectobacterium aroidearum]